MPRTKAKGLPPAWDRLYAIGAPQAGYITLAQAVAAGYSSPLVEYHVNSGRLERVGRGIFRLVHFPPTDNEDLVIRWLWSGQQGTFSHETALSLHGLSDALPSKMHMAVPQAWRKRRLRIPQGVMLHFADVAKEEVTWIGPVPLTKPLRTVADVMAHGNPELAGQAVSQAVKKGLFTRRELRDAVARRKAIGESHR